MEKLKETLKSLEIDTVDSLIDLLLTSHEYSLSDLEKPKSLFLKFAKSLEHIKDYERLWYGLSLKYLLFLIEELPLTFLKNSINRTLKDLENIDINILKNQLNKINYLLINENLDVLLLRPIYAIKDKKEVIFNSFEIEFGNMFQFIEDNRKYISKEKLNNQRFLPIRMTKQFIDNDMVAVELWIILVQDYFLREIYPLITDKIAELDLKNHEKKYVDIDLEIDKKDILELSTMIIEEIFKEAPIKESILMDIIDRMYSINIKLISNLSSKYFNI